MNNSSLVRILFGLMVVALGGMLLAQNLGWISGQHWGMFWGGFWGIVLVVAGISVLLGQRTSWFWGTLLLGVGVAIMLNAFGIITIQIWKVVFPMLVIAVGVGVLLRMGRKAGSATSDAKHDRLALFCGDEVRPEGEYTGGSLSAIFGGIQLDLRHAKVKDGAVVEVFTLCGGISILVPDDVVVHSEVNDILGGSEDNTKPKASAKKTLRVAGECILGGLEIK